MREDRKLSLDAVEEMSLSYPGRVTKSHLSRIENGQAEPTFPRMFALSRIYGVPITSLAERFESELSQALTAVDLAGRTAESLREDADRLRLEGRYEEALRFYDRLIDTTSSPSTGVTTSQLDIRIRRATCLTQLGRFVAARDELETLIGLPNIDVSFKAKALFLFITCCYRLRRFTVAMFALEPLERLVEELPPEHSLRAQIFNLRGNIHTTLGDLEAAAQSYCRAIQAYTALDETFEGCRARINYAATLMHLGKRRESKRLLAQAFETARIHGYDRHAAFALSTIAQVHYLEENLDLAESYCLRSNSIARAKEFSTVVFQNCFYLWKVARARGDESAIRSHERSLRSHLGRVEEELPEAAEYRRHLAGGEQ